MQLRMSPGGSICSSSRKRPELPPSSDTVTIAESEAMQASSVCLPTKLFRPASKVESPVPPPIATSFRLPLPFSCCKYLLPELRCAVQNDTRNQNSWEHGRLLERKESWKLIARGKNQILEIRIASQRIQILISLSSDAKAGLKIQGAIERLKGRIDGAEPGACGSESIMDMRRFGFAL